VESRVFLAEIRNGGTMNITLQEIQESVVLGKKEAVKEKIQQALDEKSDPNEILSKALIGGMREVGNRFEAGEMYVPEMLVAAHAMKAGLAILKPILIQLGTEMTDKVIIGTVKGDLHDIGKNLVAMMLEGVGYEVIDLGTDVPAEKFADAARNSSAKVVGMSALLTTTMQNMKSTIEALEDLGVREQVKVVVGGAPVTENFAKEIGADGYAPDASRAVRLVETLLTQ